MIVECLACCLYGEDSGEFTLVKAECLRQCSPGSTEEDGVKLTVVLKEDSQAFGDGEDGVPDFGERSTELTPRTFDRAHAEDVRPSSRRGLSRAVRYVLDHFVVDMLGELHCPLSSAGWAHPTAFAGEGDKEGVFSSITVYSSSPVSEDPAAETPVLVQDADHRLTFITAAVDAKAWFDGP